MARTLAVFALGAGLLFPFSHPVTLALGVALLLAALVMGVLAIATPERLAQEPHDDEIPRRRGDA